MNADATIEAAVRAVEPAARLVPERHLRKILNYLRDVGRAVPANPSLPFWIGRDDLRAADVLDRAVYADGLPQYLLLTTPDDRMIDARPRALQLQEYWRLLFRAAVLRTIDEKAARPDGDDERLSPETCASRLNHFEPWAGREIRFVLESDHVVDPESDDVARYRAFASVYLDLLHFHPSHLKDVFPSLEGQHDLVRATLGQDVDAAALYDRTKPPDAAAPEPEPEPDHVWADPPAASALPPIPALPAAAVGDPVPLLARANDAAGKGNFVRAAILRTRVAATSTGDDRDRAATAAATALGEMVRNLGAVMKWDSATQREWQQALTPLLAPAATGIWPRAARCLYELQKIPTGLSHEVYAIDLPEYIRTFGRRPVKRHLPYARVVLMLMHLKRAHAQLLRTDLDDRARFRLSHLLADESRRCEHVVRRDFTPIIRKAIKESGLNATDSVSKIAREKVVAELLDRVCDRGYLRISDLRDAIARNQLKIPDLAGPGEFLRGNALLRADVRLSYDLDGVYRRGEFYLRWLQRFSGLFFGTKIGRFLTLYLLLPFGGSFMTLMAVEELRHLGGKVVSVAGRILSQKPPAPKVAPAAAAPVPDPPVTDGKITEDEVGWDDETGEAVWVDKSITLVKQAVTASPPHATSALVAWPTVVGFGVFLLFMIHVGPFRRAVFDVLKFLWRIVKFVLWDGPRAVANSKPVNAVRKSAAARFADRYLTAALLVTLVVVLVMWALGANAGRLTKWGLITFAAVALLSNTRWGWLLQDRFAESVSDRWRVFRVNLLQGFIGGILAFFRRVANWVEQRLYAVDEWLRFRGSDSGGTIVWKAILGLLWFPVAYTTRFSFYLLLEPQVNPVKHFPVVTVSHKMLLPLTVPTGVGEASSFGSLLVTQLGMGVTEANVWAFWVIAGIPGIFGFIAWELKENWRLYDANRAKALPPVTLGSHGETMRGLLRPGFHSGTVPKLYKKMRAAAAAGDRAAAGRYEHDLHHAAEGVHRFAERELVPLLRASRGWERVDVHVGHVHFGCMRVVIDLHIDAFGTPPFRVGFENRHGQIEAAVVDRGWFDKLTEAQATAFVWALRGLLDMAAADLHEGAERGGGVPETDPADPFRELRTRHEWSDWVVKWRVPVEPK